MPDGSLIIKESGWFLVYAGVLGLIVGSFLNMLIPRLHENTGGILNGRSQCQKCKIRLGALELIPVLSYLGLRGRCRKCKKAISFWYPLIELVTALSFIALTLYTTDLITWIFQLLLFSVLLFILFYDLRYKEIHDAVMLPGIAVAFIYSVLSGFPTSALIGGAIGFSFFALQYFASKGRWIGSGDLRIGAFMGLMLGWPSTLVALMTSYIIGSFTGILLLLSGKADRKTALPLGPFLVLGTLIAFFWGTELWSWFWTV